MLLCLAIALRLDIKIADHHERLQTPVPHQLALEFGAYKLRLLLHSTLASTDGLRTASQGVTSWTDMLLANNPGPGQLVHKNTLAATRFR